jgi:axial budding pattern protein 2
MVLLALTSSITAAPNINLPINAQVPPVAVVNQPYNYVFPSSTFTSAVGSINYTIGDCPLWLQLDGSSRAFYGTPAPNGVGPGEAGSFVVNLVATDRTGSTTMPVTFVVTTAPSLAVGTPLAAQLSAFGAVSSPDVLLLTPGTSLSLTFSPNTFTNTNSQTVYYATCANNTPLPSWINFDPNSLTFSGITPQATSPAEIPQSFGIQLAASQVKGFSQASAMFEIVIESHLFTFGDTVQIINTTAGASVNFTGLLHDLTLDGRAAKPSDLGQVVANAPSWLSLDHSTLALSGTVPTNTVQQNFTVTANDTYGNTASTIVLVEIARSASVRLLGPIAILEATIGTNFMYFLNTTLASVKDMNVTVDLGTASAWLEFNSSSLVLFGHVPNNLKPQTVHFNVTATQGNQSQSQIGDINVLCGSGPCLTTSGLAGAPKATAGAGTASSPRAGGRKGWVAAAVILPLAAIAGILILLCCCRRKGWKLRLELKSKQTRKVIVSRPINHEKENDETRAGATEDPVSSRFSSSTFSSMSSKAPTIPPNWAAAVTNVRNSRLRLSRATSDGVNQGPRPQSWQSYVRTLDPSRPRHPVAVKEFSLIPEEQIPQQEQVTNHYASASPSAMAFSKVQPSHLERLSRHKKRASNMSYGNPGMISLRPVSGFGHGRSGPSEGSSIVSGSRGVGHGGGGTLGGPPGWGMVRNSWRNLSRLSWTSTQSPPNSSDPIVEEGTERPPTQKSFASMLSSFPRPSTSNTVDMFKRPHVIHEASDDDDEPHRLEQNKSLPRSYQKPRSGLSFRRGSTNNGPLQDFHKRRLQERTGHNPLFSAHLTPSRKPSLLEHQGNSDFMLETLPPQTGMSTRTYSQSSSLGTPSMRSSPARSTETVPRKKSRINYHFKTRALSPLRKSRSSFASSTGSSKFSDPIGVAPFYPGGALHEDIDEAGIKRWRHADHPNPLGTNRTEARNTTDVSDSELISSLRAAGQFSAAQRLSYLKEQIEGDGADNVERNTPFEVRSARGRRLDHNVGLRHGNTSMEAEIRDVGGSAFM